MRRIRMASLRRRARWASRSIGSTGATIVVFVPLAFISGVTGGFFKALAITMVAALVISLLYARFAIPLLAAHWLREKDAEAAERAGGLMGRLDTVYRRSSERAFARPGAFALVLGLALALGGLSCLHARTVRLHAEDGRGRLRARLQGPARRRARRHRPVASAGRADHPLYSRGRELFAPHRPATGRRTYRGRRGRLFHPPERWIAPADRAGHGRYPWPDRCAGPGARGRDLRN